MELTIVMPCLNEARTLPACVRNAFEFLDRSGIEGEVLVADNGSTDGSVQLASALGARVEHVEHKGYGAALMGGIKAAHGRFVIMADSDGSYDFSALDDFVRRLRAGDALVMGNRFKGGIEEGAMPFLHRYLGNPVLSFLGRLFFRSSVGDFHCGLRGFDRQAILRLGLNTTGMEFASEMLVKASLAGLPVSEVPTTLKPDGRGRPPHLRTWRDGWRHLRFLLMMSPRWLLLYPGMALAGLGVFAQALVWGGPFVVNGVGFDIHTLLYASAMSLLGLQLTLFAVLAKAIGCQKHVFPFGGHFRWFMQHFQLEHGLGLGGVALLFGLGLSVYSVELWMAGGLS
ncbi:MAG: glycosyltransferase family 2 protein, partial [Rubrivivax sp.]